MRTNKELLTIQESAEFLGLSTDTICKWVEDGELKGKKITPEDRRFTKNELIKMLSLGKNKYTKIKKFLNNYASQIQKISTKKHENLLHDGQADGLSHHQQQHVAIVKKLSAYLGNFKKGKAVFNKLGERLAKKSIQEGLSLEQAIDGLIFLRQSIWERLYQSSLLQSLSTDDLYTMSHIVSSYTDILTSKFAFSYEEIIEQKIESDNKYQLVVEHTMDLINLIDIDGTILYASPSWEKVSGYTAHQVVGKSAFSFIHPDDLAKIKEGFSEAAEGKVTTVPEYRLRHKKNYWITMEAIGAAVMDNKNKTHYLVTTSRDITERKQIREKLQEQAQLLQLTSDAFIVLDTNTHIVSWNKGAEKMYGYTQDEAVGKKSYKLLKTEYPIARKQIYSQIKTKGYWNGELIHSTKSGERITVDSDWSVMSNSNNSLILEVNRNITERKKLEQRKDDFVALASHELKTPVTSMKMFTQVLEKRFQKMGDVTSASFLINMDKQLNKLSEIINGLLDVSRVQQGKLLYKKEEFIIDELIKETVENVQRTTDNHRIIIKGQTHKKIIADRDRIGQVLINLLTNAIKYSPHAKVVKVNAKTVDASVVISVQDFGIGILKEQQKKIFDRFFQVSIPTAKTYPGLGLGLYITKEIVDRHNGEIWVESKKGKGSTFYFTLPTIEKTVSHP